MGVSRTARIAAVLVAGLLGLLAMGCRSSREWTILPAQEAEELRNPCSRPFPEGMSHYWKPSPRDVAKAEQALPAAIQAEITRLAKEEGRPQQKSAWYYRQYVGFVRDGRRVLYLTAVDTDLGVDWRRRWLRSCDAWTSAFGAVYDLEKGEFDWFSFDGGLPPLPPPPPK